MVPARSRGLSAALLVLSSLPLAQEEPPSPEDAVLPGRTVVTAARGERSLEDTPYAVDVIDEEELRRRQYRTLPRMLENTPGVMVQETSHGQGSPYLRGFTGFRTLLLVDGVRLNNSVFRDGPNQYANTIDPYSLARVEVLKGPGSVLYGSDAIGGVIHAITKDPSAWEPGRNVGGSFHYRVSSAENSHVGRVEVDVTDARDTGLLVGGTGKTYGDLVGGEDTGTQPYTGYDEWDADVKLEQLLPGDRRLVFLYQEVHQNDVPRTHSTIHAVPFEGTTVGSDRRRDLDQLRRLTYLQLQGERSRVGVSYQRQEESRDRIRGSGAREMQGFTVDTLGLFGNLTLPSALGTWTVGGDWYHDEVDSFSTTNPIQGPVADDASYDLLGLFVQDEIALDERTRLVAGARFEHAAADADSVQDPLGPGAISIEDDWSTVVGSLRLLRELDETTRLWGGVSQGYRAPNLSDLTRLDTARTNEFEIASPGLDPERFLTVEVGVGRAEEDASAELAVFYTDVDDAIVRFPTGNTNPSGEFEVVKDNVGDGYTFGIELALAWRFRPEWTAFASGTYMDGKVDTYPTSAQVVEEEYLDRLMPTTVFLGLGWEPEDGDRWAEATLRLVDDADRLSTRDEGDTSRIPPGGTPGHALLGVRGGVALGEHVRLDVALENLTDEDYRVHGSGTNSAGRNLVVGLTVRR